MIQETVEAPVRRRRIRPTGESSPQARHALYSGTIGSALEWFDFAVYGALSATVFPALFFHQMDPAMGLLASFATFGIGFLARPLGGIFFGYLGDKLGRRTILLVTFISMGLASLVIGLLPPYSSIGFTAPLILVLMRFFQGFALGGEATGAQLMSMEHAPDDRRSFYGALIAMGAPISQVLATLSLAIISGTLSTEAFAEWGWRIPFLLSILLVIVGIYIRLKVEETPVFRAQVQDVKEEKTANPLSVLKSHGVVILRLMLAFSPITITFYTVSVFGISYMTKHGYTSSETFTIMMIANSLSIIAIWWGGRVADVYGRRKVLFIGGAVTLVCAVLFFPIINLNSFPLALLIVSVALCGAMFGNAAQGALFAEAFPTKVRYTGSALSLTGASLVFSAPIPFVASWLLSIGQGTIPITIFWAVTIAVALVNLYWMREGKTLEGKTQSFGTGRLSR